MWNGNKSYLCGMTFAEKVYAAVKRIPRGRVATYGQIAEMIGCPGGSRAVGNALHVNPFAPVVPCHRVVSAGGSLAANFGGGGPALQYERLQAEGVTFTDPLHVDLSKCGIVIENHPLEPFLPANGRILFLGSFPPPKVRWSMDFFYPNWINDFWRIQGLVRFGDAHHFEMEGRRFDRERIIEFCNMKGLAFYDTASKVCRLKGNASDEYLEIIEPADIAKLLSGMPDCHTVVTTGGKSSEEFADIMSAGPVPALGSFSDLDSIRWWRMPSTSRAYPMSLKDKAAFYAQLYQASADAPRMAASDSLREE